VETTQQIVTRRTIKLLFHFTRVENLDAILAHGLLAKTDFAARELTPTVNDALRLDGFPNASNVSIGFPNYKMFYSYRMADTSVKWAIVAFEPRVLWEKDCAFCMENAAKNSVTAVPIEERKGPEALERLFGEFEAKPSRAEMRLIDAYPTCPQAEVLVFGVIEPEYIVGVAFNERGLADAYKVKVTNKKIVFNYELYSYRLDYKHWQ
jgi:hypothetical protein